MKTGGDARATRVVKIPGLRRERSRMGHPATEMGNPRPSITVRTVLPARGTLVLIGRLPLFTLRSSSAVSR